MVFAISLVCFAIISVLHSTQAYDHVLVDMVDGPVQGDVLTLHTGVKVNTFLGIQFAEAPVGALRWQVTS